MENQLHENKTEDRTRKRYYILSAKRISKWNAQVAVLCWWMISVNFSFFIPLHYFFCSFVGLDSFQLFHIIFVLICVKCGGLKNDVILTIFVWHRDQVVLISTSMLLINWNIFRYFGTIVE